jgi:hypothetical protein
MHKVGKVYKVITFAKPDSCIYVEDEDGFQHLTFTTFLDFLYKKLYITSDDKQSF